jgi:hypothetical protein
MVIFYLKIINDLVRGMVSVDPNMNPNKFLLDLLLGLP